MQLWTAFSVHLGRGFLKTIATARKNDTRFWAQKITIAIGWRKKMADTFCFCANEWSSPNVSLVASISQW